MKHSCYLLFIIFLFIAVQGCQSTLHVPVLQPAEINLPAYYEKLAVVHRHSASKENKALNIIEGVFTGEGFQADKEGGVSCLSGLKDALLATPRYLLVEPAGLDLKGTGTGTFPTPIGWEEVEKICKANDADALIVLEVFDSNSGVSHSTIPKKVKNKEGIEITIIEHYAEMRMNITAGWRIYDYQNKIIVDEFKGETYLDFNGKGSSPEEAVSRLPIKREAIKRTGFQAGNSYGFRIAPQWVTVSRVYYNKGSEGLKRAARMARVNDWNGASLIWEELSKNPRKKIAKRSTYNMAIALEVLGDLEGAHEWAGKAYKLYGGQQALNYSYILNQRIKDRNKVNEQMK